MTAPIPKASITSGICSQGVYDSASRTIEAPAIRMHAVANRPREMRLAMKNGRGDHDPAGLRRRKSAGLDEKGRQPDDREGNRPISGKAADRDSEEGTGGQQLGIRHTRSGLILPLNTDVDRPFLPDHHPRHNPDDAD